MSESKHLYPEMVPSQRINRLFEEFISPSLLNEGFKYSKSQKSYKKKIGLLDFKISYFCNHRNVSNHVVKFDMFVNIFSTKYRKWEQNTYNFETIDKNSMAGSHIEYFSGWDKTYMQGGWYDLVKHDNRIVFNNLLENIENVAFKFFSNFETFDKGILYMKNPILENKKDINKYFFRIFDFYLIQDKVSQAITFFELNNQYFESKLESGLSELYEKHYLARINKAIELKDVC